MTTIKDKDKLKFNSVLGEMKLRMVGRAAVATAMDDSCTLTRGDTIASVLSNVMTCGDDRRTGQVSRKAPHSSLGSYIEAVIDDAIRNVCGDLYAYGGSERERAWELLLGHLSQQSLMHHELSRAQLSLGSLLGRGKFAAVYRGIVDNGNDCKEVAVKVFQYRSTTIQVVSSSDLQFTPFADVTRTVDMGELPSAADNSRLQIYPPVKCIEEFQREV